MLRYRPGAQAGLVQLDDPAASRGRQPLSRCVAGPLRARVGLRKGVGIRVRQDNQSMKALRNQGFHALWISRLLRGA